ncbi:hypothetical protein Hte_001823 [Hypoxylon texense]
MPWQPSPPPPYAEDNNLLEDDNASTYEQEMPPPYSAPPPAYTAAGPRPRPNPTPAPTRRSVSSIIAEMPNVVTAYWPKRNVSGEFYLGESPDKVLFRVSRGLLSSLGPITVLYVGPDNNPLALGKLERLPRSDFHHETTAIEIYTPGNVHEQPVVHMTTLGRPEGFSRMEYYFSMEVGRDDQRRTEKFEWRPSRGHEVRSVDTHGEGWKLVRTQVAAPTGGQGGGRRTRSIDESSDGKEIVAIWVTNVHERQPNKTPFQFALRGSGKNGMLGKHFGFVALMTALRVWCTSDSLHPRDNPVRGHR